MDSLDDTIRQAMTALEGRVTPHGYFDELPAAIDARLEASMQFDQDRHGSEGLPPGMGGERVDDSGLHDIKALAQTQKARIRRQTSQHDAEEALLTSSSSGLHAVALPDPALTSQSSIEQVRELARSSPGLPAVTAEARPARPAKKHPAPARGVPVWLWAGGGVAVAGALAAVAFMMTGGSDPKPAREAAEPATEPSPRLERAAAESKAAPTPKVEALPPSPAPEPGATATGAATADAAAADQVAQEPTDLDVQGKREGTGFRRDDRTEREVDARRNRAGGGDDKDGDARREPEEKKPSDQTKPKQDAKLDGAVLEEGDEDELGIGEALRGDGGKAKTPTKTELTSKEIRAGLGAINGKAKACYDKYGIAGTVKVRLTIDPSGNVSKASASGDFAGTPTGDCVAAAVKSASFPTWDGAPVSTTHVVLLAD